MTRESAPKGALTIVAGKRDQIQGSSAALLIGDHRGPLPLHDLERYAGSLASLDGGVDGMSDGEVVHVLAFAMRRVADSIGFVLRGVT
jgi:hypothetical protein